MFNLTEDQKTAVKNYAAAHAAFTTHYSRMLAAELMAQEALWIGTNLGLPRDEIVCPRMAQYLPQPEMED